ncbi:uncharacterized protein LOC111615627, partial [Centruroides sculpturatus]|uniref:uncharacterized protein LOC111615627 n=1 Tax=Centruroides sculpturatus TaxID=218467 RepID=UPI000C6C8A24
MATLVEIIGETLKSASTSSIRLLHQLVFEEVGDRNNRKRLRTFGGFNFPSKEDENLKKKVQYINENFRLNDLVVLCNLLNVQYDGTKDEIVERLVLSLSDLKSLQSNLILADVDTEDEDALEVQTVTDDPPSNNCLRVSDMTKLSINFHDVKNVIKPFDGSEYCSIDKWLVAFEDFAKMMTWSDLHKFIFAKQSLTGLAKLFVESQSGINSWDKLKSELKAEFGSKYNSARLHGMLAKRQMLPNESVQEYFFKMQELASHGKIEPDGLIEY